MSNALYIGSFDMFTNGHLDIVKQALPLFDKIIICIASNPLKKRRYTVLSSLAFITSALEKAEIDKTKVFVILSSDDSQLATDIARTNSCDYIIRGLRNTSDYLFEEQIAQVYKAANPEIKIIYFYANTNVSSSMVEHLRRGNHSIDEYVTGNVSLLERREYK